MARYLAEVEGQGQPVHRLGSPNSGIRAQAQGWDLGVQIHGNPKPLDDSRDMFTIRITGGSNDWLVPVDIGTVQTTEDGRITFTLSDDVYERIDLTYQTAVIAP